MNTYIKVLCFVCLCFLFLEHSNAQDTALNNIPLSDFSAFVKPGENWVITSSFLSDFSEPWNIKKLAQGTGVIVNDLSKKHRSHLVTKKEFGDVDLELDFMMDKGSNSGIYLEGRYELQLLDSWLNQDPTYADCGGIYQRWDESRKVKGFEGMAPLSNAARAPGLWQHLRIRFRAPRFDSNGNKTANARFEKVYLNGVLVQEQVEVSGPTRAALFDDEKPTGPLVFQGDHGKVAFRNICYDTTMNIPTPKNDHPNGLIMVKPDRKPYLLRSFMMFEDKKLDYVISMGTQQGLNYSYDLAQGAWLQVWRGGFMDVTDMWHSRGESQLAVPLGGVIPLSDGPTLAHLNNIDAKWPESIAFEDMHDKSYLLDKEGIPTFEYMLQGVKISDKIIPQDNGKALQRTLKIENSIDDLFCRVVSANNIEPVGKGLYRVDGIYYIRLDRDSDPMIRSTAQGQEMLVSIGKLPPPFTYSIIW